MEESNAKCARRKKVLIEYVKDQKKKGVEVEKEKVALVDRVARLESDREADRDLIASQNRTIEIL